MTKTHKNMDSHLYRNVYDKNPYKNNMNSHSYRNMNDKNQYKNKVDSHLYRNVHDENPYTRKWIVIRTNMYITKPHSKDMDSHSY